MSLHVVQLKIRRTRRDRVRSDEARRIRSDLKLRSSFNALITTPRYRQSRTGGSGAVILEGVLGIRLLSARTATRSGRESERGEEERRRYARTRAHKDVYKARVRLSRSYRPDIPRLPPFPTARAGFSPSSDDGGEFRRDAERSRAHREIEPGQGSSGSRKCGPVRALESPCRTPGPSPASARRIPEVFPGRRLRRPVPRRRDDRLTTGNERRVGERGRGPRPSLLTGATWTRAGGSPRYPSRPSPPGEEVASRRASPTRPYPLAAIFDGASSSAELKLSSTEPSLRGSSRGINKHLSTQAIGSICPRNIVEPTISAPVDYIRAEIRRDSRQCDERVHSWESRSIGTLCREPVASYLTSQLGVVEVLIFEKKYILEQSAIKYSVYIFRNCSSETIQDETNLHPLIVFNDWLFMLMLQFEYARVHATLRQLTVIEDTQCQFDSSNTPNYHQIRISIGIIKLENCDIAVEQYKQNQLKISYLECAQMSRDNIGFARIVAMLRQRSRGFHVIAIRDHNRTTAQRSRKKQEQNKNKKFIREKEYMRGTVLSLHISVFVEAAAGTTLITN
ncbi:hypothetical protein EAG_06692 [Camponotus floridanus]|uniref:Uncharacterized protein n=1 Tax=Camponotus floridanus TaxID=104421 RepID=E2A597_CAMFO|nr:hypothetical protein EAG_06692 [Camponotus floridanus]